MKSSKLFCFFNLLFFIILSVIHLFNVNLFSNVICHSLEKNYQYFWKKMERNLAEGESSSQITGKKSDDFQPGILYEQIIIICDCLFDGHKDTLFNIRSLPDDNPEPLCFKDGLFIGDKLYHRLQWSQLNPSYKLIRNEIKRVKECNALIISMGNIRDVIEYVLDIFKLENDLTKVLLHSMIGKSQEDITRIIRDESSIISKILEELQLRNLQLPESQVRRSMFRISRRAHDIANELGILYGHIPEPIDCYLEEYSD
ncbi:hypothetical protein PGAL8A_00449000 [Plasmodium gallinaceum]|uniref:Uncharacterized protein n=1 Tax=Plasmodium gallinaceum TaxID=5849 RepID=A0A1J1H0V7_PLAGA|nr:hypothetical protein PGAL8A_00449000 [Plasmodium gallinaceum]CRG96909.1 hypothetical protein PGAL8A_00449000 [Plasmodium gallinaceum]